MGVSTLSSPHLAGWPIYIENNGFLLRSLTPQDLTPRLEQWFEGPELMKSLNLPFSYFSKVSLPRYIAEFDNVSNYLVGIFSHEGKRLLGFYIFDVNPSHKIAHMNAAAIEPVHQGKDVLWCTSEAVLDYFFEEVGVEKVIGKVLANNKRALFSFVGMDRFVLEAKLHKEHVDLDGNRVDVLVFSSFKDRQEMRKAGKPLQ